MEIDTVDYDKSLYDKCYFVGPQVCVYGNRNSIFIKIHPIKQINVLLVVTTINAKKNSFNY